MKTLVEFAADYISNQADRRGHLTEASPIARRALVQAEVDRLSKKDLNGHKIKYDGVLVHVFHPSGRNIGSIKPYPGMDLERDVRNVFRAGGYLNSAPRGNNDKQSSDDELAKNKYLANVLSS